jgi:aarF domain-containing kinase
MLDRHFVFLNIVAHINIQEFTTTQVLTMQFCKGFKVDDVESLKRTNVSPEKVAKVLVEVFAEMIFVHGFIHGDPHPGNILVSPEGQNGFSLGTLCS